MRIVTLDPDVNLLEPCDIEVPLARFASSPDRLASARWQRLLELVRVLRSQGSYPEVCGTIVGNELCLSSTNPHHRVWVRVWADSRDYGPIHDGLPILHYRIQVQRPKVPLSIDARMEQPEEASRFIQQVFDRLE